jgi:hypothetical protein
MTTYEYSCRFDSRTFTDLDEAKEAVRDLLRIGGNEAGFVLRRRRVGACDWTNWLQMRWEGPDWGQGQILEIFTHEPDIPELNLTEGWVRGICSCGWESHPIPVPDLTLATEAWAQHAVDAQ